MKARLVANLNWLVTDKMLRLVGGLLIGVWTARYLGPEDFGLLNYALAFVALFGTVAKLGIDQVVVRDLGRAPDKERAVLGTVFVLKLAASVIAFFLVLAAAWIVRGGDFSFTLIVAVIAVGMLFNALDAYDLHYQAHLLSRYVVLSRGAAFLIFMAVRAALILGEFSVVYFAAVATLEIAIGSAFLFLTYTRRQSPRRNWCFDRTVMKQLLTDGWPLIVSSALIIIHTRLDQVMIGQMLGNAAVGIYSAAIRLSELWLFIPGLVVQTLMPYFVKIKATNAKLYNARLMQLYSIMFWLGAFMGLVITIFGEFFVVTLFGESYRDAVLPLTLTIWTGIFISQSLARGIWMIGENMQGYRLANNIIAVPINITLNWLLIPKYGVVGASVASLASIGFGAWVVPFMFKSLRSSNTQMLMAINPKYLLRGVA